MSAAAPVLEANPLREGLEQERVPESSCLVIFGASLVLSLRIHMTPVGVLGLAALAGLAWKAPSEQ